MRSSDDIRCVMSLTEAGGKVCEGIETGLSCDTGRPEQPSAAHAIWKACASSPQPLVCSSRPAFLQPGLATGSSPYILHCSFSFYSPRPLELLPILLSSRLSSVPSISVLTLLRSTARLLYFHHMIASSPPALCPHTFLTRP